MIPNPLRMLALASAVLIGSGYIWWAANRTPNGTSGAAGSAAEVKAGADPTEEDINPHEVAPTHIMLSSKRIEMPIFSTQRAGGTVSPPMDPDKVENYVETIEIGPSEQDPSAWRVVTFRTGTLEPRAAAQSAESAESELVAEPVLELEPGATQDLIPAPGSQEPAPEPLPQQP
jgi:hypothetical protein